MQHKQCKLTVAGDAGVGKTALLIRMGTDKFQEKNICMTLGLDFQMRIMQVD